MMVSSRRMKIGVTFALLFVISAVFGMSNRGAAQDLPIANTRSVQTTVVEENVRALDSDLPANTVLLAEEGRRIFRFDTFGDEDFWGDTLQLHKAIEGAKLGGVGSGVSPRTALAVGLKVDIDALPESLVDALQQGRVNLDDPATTVALLKLDAVLGVKGHFNSQGRLSSIGIQCAFCHSVVDNSLAPGIGHRL